MRWLQFILSHSIFIAFCAVALCYQSYALMKADPDYFVYGVVFFSTLCSYNFYWLISKYSFTRPENEPGFYTKNRSYIILFFLSAIGMFTCMYFVPVILPYIIVGVLLTLIYSLPLWPFFQSFKLQKVGFLKTTLLAFTWAYVTSIMPLAVHEKFTWQQLILLLTDRFFFMLLLCAIFDMRDMKVDKLHALHSLATALSKRTFKTLMLLVFISYIVLGILVRYQVGNTIQIASLLLTGLAVGIVYQLSLKPRGYIFYYFLVDGLMLFSAFTTLVCKLI